jgi:hypothetical protein
MAPPGDVLHRGIVVEPLADHPLDEDMIRNEFIPPVTTVLSCDSIAFVTFLLNRVTVGWCCSGSPCRLEHLPEAFHR